VSLELDEAALGDLVDSLDGLRRRSDDLSPALRAVADDFRELSRDRFRAGNGWAPATAGYAARKAAAGKGRTVGRYTGRLEASLTSRRARWHAETVAPDYVKVASRAPHAHLFDAGRGGQRSRDLVVLRAEDRRRWRRILTDYLLRGDLP
jgi:hypothetical protein